MFNVKALIITCLILSLTGCSTAYYAAMEKVGIHKREILVDRVEEASEAQEEAKQEFVSALEQLSELIAFDGGELEKHYQLSKSHYEASAKAAEDVSGRINAIENVAQALFDEWQEEIDQYSSASLKRQSQSKLRETELNYQSVLKALRKAESKMPPVLTALKDNMLYLKHNLNAQAIGAIKGEYHTIKKDIDVLIKEMNSAINRSQSFIDTIKAS